MDSNIYNGVLKKAAKLQDKAACQGTKKVKDGEDVYHMTYDRYQGYWEVKDSEGNKVINISITPFTKAKKHLIHWLNN